MDQPEFPQDFKEFLRLLTESGVEYLVVGGYAVGYHGYPRTTADLDVWVRISKENAARLVKTFHEFGMPVEQLNPEIFLEKDKVIRMGVPPLRIEVLTAIDGVEFDDCYANRVTYEIGGQTVNFIALPDLRTNKRAAGRHKDLDDLRHLPPS